ncbi:unnamed protein product, partial [Staurois parvus]
MGPLGNRASWGPCVLAQTPKSLLKRYQGHLMGPPTDPGPSGSARVSKWSVRPWAYTILPKVLGQPSKSLVTQGPRAVPRFPNGQSTPVH